jgi:hypothetical protein
MKTVTLEPSTNTHAIHSEEIRVTDMGHGILKLDIPAGDAVVTHGEHGTLATESKYVMKYVQQEVNPLTKKMQAAFD